MKKIITLLSVFLLVVFSACSLQEKMSPEIFIERLSAESEITIKNKFYDKEKFVFYFADKYSNDYIIQIDSDNAGNAKKICLACTKADKAEIFKSMIETVIRIYAPDENIEESISSLFSKEWNYFNSQWYRYSSAVSQNGLFFSIESVKLSTETDAELTLKLNDISP